MTPFLASRPRQSLRAVLLASALSAVALTGAGMTPVLAGVPLDGYADLVAKVSPEVVFVEVTMKAPQQDAAMPGMGTSPFDEFFRRFGETRPEMRPQQAPQDGGVMHGLGSGFIISADGEIVTNNHVVDGATSIKVKLQDGSEHSAHVVGTDPLTDVALIKLDKAEGLPVSEFGAEGALRVGDAVVAIGNPFGLGGTVTSGIVSAMGRNINAGPYDDFIQTDAAINKGNSGGPLFNSAGEVVGMNTAIFSPSGGSVGIGFAVPAATIQTVVAQLRDHGEVARGWLGVQIQPVNADLAQALGMDKAAGALVAEVLPDGPAAGSSLKSGDVILAVNGKTVDETHGLPSIIAAVPSGTTADLSVLRAGKTETVSVKIGVLNPENLQLASASPADQGTTSLSLGIKVEPLTADMLAQFGLDAGTRGVLVSEVAPDSPNADRLLPGDVITEAAHQPVTSPEALSKALQAAGDKRAVLLKVIRDGKALFIGAEYPVL